MLSDHIGITLEVVDTRASYEKEIKAYFGAEKGAQVYERGTQRAEAKIKNLG